MYNQKGVIHLAVPFLLLLIAVVVFALLFLGVIKNPLQNIPFLNNIRLPGSNAGIKTDYQNPFKKETQYVNPFETYKNPFEVAK